MLATENLSLSATPKVSNFQRAGGVAARCFAKVGALPMLLAMALVIFSTMSPSFLTEDNLLSMLRQNSYVTIVVLAQFVVLVAGGIDLSVGAITALVSVSSAITMSNQFAGGSDP